MNGRESTAEKQIMNAAEVIRLIDERFDIVDLLTELTHRQLDAITAGHMSALMQLLSQKQEPLARLHEVSTRLRLALEATPTTTLPWDSDAQRDACRRRHQQSESKLAELLQQEAECEQRLVAQRQAIGEELVELGNSHRAANGYSQAISTGRQGSSLDLTSDQ
jgi:hypothetical protein